mmetsp:Transcript_53366/g.127301  ORF Transcript_53366/g.127301 Transcript_53366/m.127301 type:complete len:321 (-) Transcript_53366:190-1152(-)
MQGHKRRGHRHLGHNIASRIGYQSNAYPWKDSCKQQAHRCPNDQDGSMSCIRSSQSCYQGVMTDRNIGTSSSSREVCQTQKTNAFLKLTTSRSASLWDALLCKTQRRSGLTARFTATSSCASLPGDASADCGRCVEGVASAANLGSSTHGLAPTSSTSITFGGIDLTTSRQCLYKTCCPQLESRADGSCHTITKTSSSSVARYSTSDGQEGVACVSSASALLPRAWTATRMWSASLGEAQDSFQSRLSESPPQRARWSSPTCKPSITLPSTLGPSTSSTWTVQRSVNSLHSSLSAASFVMTSFVGGRCARSNSATKLSGS